MGGAVGTGTASANDPGGTNEIWLQNHDFHPDEFTLDLSGGGSETVTWLHQDESEGGGHHNVHIHSHEEGGDRLMSSGSLTFGDDYPVNFDYDGGTTLTVSDGNQEKAITVSGGDHHFGVHCDFHLGQTEGGMQMEKFEVEL